MIVTLQGSTHSIMDRVRLFGVVASPSASILVIYPLISSFGGIVAGFATSSWLLLFSLALPMFGSWTLGMSCVHSGMESYHAAHCTGRIADWRKCAPWC